jgi:hypothetical protein
MSHVDVIPLVVVPLSFLFVLLIILIVKAPKAGAWVVGGLILLAPILLWRLATTGLPAVPDAEVLIILPAVYLFVLLIILLTKAPKAAAGLIVALVVMGVFTLFAQVLVSHQLSQVLGSHQPRATVQVTTPRSPAIPEPLAPPPIPQPPALPAPIWSSGVEAEMDADVYPSKLAAVRALGSRLDRPVRELVGEVNAPPRITIFQEESERALVVELKNAVQQVLPLATVQVEAEQKNLDSGQVGVTLRLADLDMQPAPWTDSREVKTASGKVELNLATTTGGAAVQGRFVEKPWLENFATFASTRPQQAFIIARSLGTCTSEGEAYQQALDDARARLTEATSQRGQWMSDRLPKPQITATDVLQGGFVVDRFAQSFEGTVGKVWRQALLLDVSGPKLAQLARQKAGEFRQAKMTWARMGFSAIGVVVLIGVIYFFLNMATMGYYEWSLRIACVVLAIVGVLSILMVVH